MRTYEGLTDSSVAVLQISLGLETTFKGSRLRLSDSEDSFLSQSRTGRTLDF